MSLPPDTVIGKYRVLRKLAEGGMAEIFLCSSQGLEGFAKEVVIKRIRSFLANDPEFISMFIAEAQIASLLNHPNIVQIFDFDKHEDTYYLAMEYVRGQSLWGVRVESQRLMLPIPPLLVAQIGAQVGRGLDYAHHLTDASGRFLGLVHRDVTPHNVLLSYDGAVKLTDFGIAKASTRVTAPGMIKGKFAYMAPEQARGEEVDARSDIFSLGIVLWELLAGATLFDGQSDVAVLKAVQEAEIRPLTAMNADVPEQLEDVVLRALQRDPKARFQTAEEFARGLDRCIFECAKSFEDTDLRGFLSLLMTQGGGTMVLPSGATPPRPVAPIPLTPKPQKPIPLKLEPQTTPRPRPVPPREFTPRPVAESDLDSKPEKASPLRPALIAIVAAVLGGVGVGAAVKLWSPSSPPTAAPVERPAELNHAPPPLAQNPTPKPEAKDLVSAKEPEKDTQATQAHEPAGPTTPKETLPAKQDPEPQRPGMLRVIARPWAQVSIDGRKSREVEGSQSFRLPAGDHTVRLVHVHTVKTESVTIEPGKTRLIEFYPLKAQ